MGEIRIKRDNSDWDNRPAHQFTNGQWVDIPTHHFINNRWQGELTSQSPLKFRADGEMLDWRVEGKTSGNLFDVNGNYSAYVYQGSPTCGVENEQIIVNSIAPYYFTYINFSALIPSGRYTVKCKASANFRAMRLLLTKPFETGTWNESYQRYYADMVKNNNYYTYTFTVDEDFAIGFAISGTTGDTGVIDEIMLNLGSTALPYEPYGNGVGDWDETTQRYKIPVRVEGENLYTIELGDDRWGTLANSQIISRTDGVLQIEMTSETNSGVYALSASAIRQLSDIRNTVSYSFDIRADTDISVLVGYEVQGARAILQVSDEWVTVKFENILFTQSYGFTIVNRSSGGTVYVRNFMFNEGSTAFPYEGITTNLFTDHQLMDGDSIDFATTQTAIPLTTGNNILSVDTAVKPKSVFVKFEG